MSAGCSSVGDDPSGPSPYAFNDAFRARVSDTLSRFPVNVVDDPALRQAAVVIVLVAEPTTREASILLTLRPRTIKRHAGQYALPGGRLDDGETVHQAALRELQEELGLHLGEADILGRLDDYPTRSGFRMAPIVAWCNTDHVLVPEPNEVETVFYVPLAQLDSDDIPLLTPSEDGSGTVLSMYLPALRNRMFAPTAAVFYQFREVVMRGLETRVAGYDQPGFAWR